MHWSQALQQAEMLRELLHLEGCSAVCPELNKEQGMTPFGISKVATWHSRGVACTLQDVADMKKEINDEDLLALITDEVNQPPQLWALVDLQVGRGQED